MAQLHRTLYSLKEAGLVYDWDVVKTSHQAASCAMVKVKGGSRLGIVIGDDYYEVTFADVTEGYQALELQNFGMNYVVLQAWQQISQQAHDFCDENGVEVVDYNRFRQILWSL